MRNKAREFLRKDIKEGAFVREWSVEQSTGSARFEALRRKALAHPMSIAEDNVIRAIQSAHSLDAKK
jgi:ketol-acid reductoisomerase